jgi:hypothetical protein
MGSIAQPSASLVPAPVLRYCVVPVCVFLARRKGRRSCRGFRFHQVTEPRIGTVDQFGLSFGISLPSAFW